jgi:hypothetical protein
MAPLACVGVHEEGFREVLAVEVAGTEKGTAYASLLRGLLDRGLKGVHLMVSADHEGIKPAVPASCPGCAGSGASYTSSATCWPTCRHPPCARSPRTSRLSSR